MTPEGAAFLSVARSPIDASADADRVSTMNRKQRTIANGGGDQVNAEDGITHTCLRCQNGGFNVASRFMLVLFTTLATGFPGASTK